MCLLCFKSARSGIPNPWTTDQYWSGLWPVRNLETRLHSRRWVAGKVVKPHWYLQPYSIAGITTWAPPPVRSVALDSHSSTNSTVNCAWEGSRLHTPYEIRMPDELRWSWGGDARAGERPQIHPCICREVWLHKDHNKSIACRLISKPYEWVARNH